MDGMCNDSPLEDKTMTPSRHAVSALLAQGHAVATEWSVQGEYQISAFIRWILTLSMSDTVRYRLCGEAESVCILPSGH